MFSDKKGRLQVNSSSLVIGAMAAGLCWAEPALAQTSPGKAPESASTPEATTPSEPEAKAEVEESSEAASKEEGEPSAEKGEEKDVKETELNELSEEEKKEAQEASASPEPKKEETKEAGKKAAAAKAVPAKKKPEPVIDYDSLPITYHQWRFDIGMGPRLSWVTDSSFDLFSDGNVSPSFNLRGAGTVFASGQVSLALTGDWDIAGASSGVRDISTKIDWNRVQLGAEARYHFLPRLAAYSRLSAGLNILSSSLGAEGTQERLELSSVNFAGALTVGTAFRIAGSRDGRERALRAHLYVEGGFVYVSNVNLEYEIGDDGPLRPEPVDLGTLSLSAPQAAAGLLVSY